MDYTAAQHLEEGIRLVVREETADMRSDIAEMQIDVGDLRTDVNVLRKDVDGLRKDVNVLRKDVGGLRRDVTGLREDVDDLKQEVFRHGVLIEDIQSKIDAILEMLSEALGIRKVVGKHDRRLDGLEANQHLLTATVKNHSRRLKAA